MNFKFILLAATSTAFTFTNYGAIALNVDFTDPSAVVVTATGANSLVNDSGNLSGNGFQLLGALPNNSTSFTDIGSTVASTLIPGGTGTEPGDFANQAYTDSTQSGGVTSLNLYRNPNNGFWAVSTSEPAFLGTATYDLSNPLIGALPSIGDSGNIVIGYDLVSGVVGTWVAVPEPATYTTIVGLSALVMATFLRRRRATK